jgi:hypothetical protein
MDIIDGSGLWTVGQGAAAPEPEPEPEPPVVVTVGGGAPLSRLRRLLFWRRIWGDEPVPEREIQTQIETPYLTDDTLERLRRIEEDDEDIMRLI